MDKSNSIKRVCGFYVSSIHLITMLLPYLNKQLEENIKVIPFLEFDLRKNVETILSKIMLSQRNKENLLKINWKNIKVQKFANVENKIKKEMQNEKEVIILISGSKKYIEMANEMVERYFSKYKGYKRYVTIINCFEVGDFDDDIKEILDGHEYIINTAGVNKIADIFETYKEKRLID